MADSAITLVTGGMIYTGWTGMAVNREIDRLGSHFSISVTEAWATGDQPWQIRRFDPCQVLVDGDPVITGYVTDYAPSFDPENHSVTVTGASKTVDLVECTPDVPSGQYKGYTLEQIATAITSLFGIGLVVETDATQIFPDATLQRGEEAFKFLERLGRLAGVLLTDDELGNLVLTTTGTKRAGGSLVQGLNVTHARGKLSASKRFSQYIVKGQRAQGSAAGQSEQGGAGGTAAAPAGVVTNLRAVATDPLVPRYRPKVSMCEAQLDQAGMQRRANWERNYALGRSTEAEVQVVGWRDANGDLWRINRLVSTTIPWLQIDQDLLIAGVGLKIDDKGGRTATLKLGPVEGYTPDPGQVLQHCRRGKHKRGAANEWAGAVP